MSPRATQLERGKIRTRTLVSQLPSPGPFEAQKISMDHSIDCSHFLPLPIVAGTGPAQGLRPCPPVEIQPPTCPQGQGGPMVATACHPNLLRAQGKWRGADRHCRGEGPGTAPGPLAAAQRPPVTAGLGPSPLQYFVFDFHVSPDVMFDKIIKISVSGEQPLACRDISSHCTFVQT